MMKYTSIKVHNLLPVTRYYVRYIQPRWVTPVQHSIPSTKGNLQHYDYTRKVQLF